jgi:hypothetical protein
MCTACHPSDPEQPPNPTTVPVRPSGGSLPKLPATSLAGASAQLMYEKKHRGRQADMDAKWGRLSGVVKFLSDDPQSIKAWAKGARGERALADYLRSTVGDRTVMLNDLRIPRSRANIDHIVIAASGIWIVDAKSYSGKVEQRDVGGWLKTDKRLYVNGRDQSRLVVGLVKQINAVYEAIQDADISVKAALCFVDSEWGRFAKPFLQGGALVTWPERLSQAIAEPGPLTPVEVLRVGQQLARALPAAVGT